MNVRKFLKWRKGFRTIFWHVMSTVSVVVAGLLTIEWYSLGFEAKTVTIILIVLKVADAIVGVFLRLRTDTPVGQSE